MDGLLEFGVNAPWPHQRIITRLTSKLYILYEEGKIKFEPLSETMIDSGQVSEVPDIMLVDTNEKVWLVIEITSSKGLKKDIRKLNGFFTDYEVQEGFVYDYQAKNWYKFTLQAGEVKTKPSYSDLIAYDLEELLKSKN